MGTSWNQVRAGTRGIGRAAALLVAGLLAGALGEAQSVHYVLTEDSWMWAGKQFGFPDVPSENKAMQGRCLLLFFETPGEVGSAAVFREFDLSAGEYRISGSSGRYERGRTSSGVVRECARLTGNMGGAIVYLESGGDFGQCPSSRSEPPEIRVVTEGFVVGHPTVGYVRLFIVAFPSKEDAHLFFVRGDVTGDGVRNISDAIQLVNALFAETSLGCLDAADADDNGSVDITDAVAILRHLFAGAGPLPRPFRECGIDMTEDLLDCQGSYACLGGGH